MGVGDTVWIGEPESRELPDSRSVWDTEPEDEPETDGFRELEGDEDTEASELGELEKLDELDSTGVNVWDRDGVVVNEPWPDGVGDTVGLTVVLGEADNDRWDVDVLDTEGEPVVVFDFIGVAVLLGETVPDLDIKGVRVTFDVRVPVLDIELELDTEFVDE